MQRLFVPVKQSPGPGKRIRFEADVPRGVCRKASYFIDLSDRGKPKAWCQVEVADDRAARITATVARKDLPKQAADYLDARAAHAARSLA